jgi:OOP family OmpA-OmpF porin
VILMGGLLGGCATKKFVRQQVSPVSGKLDQVATKTDQQGQTLDQTKQSLDQAKQTLDQTRTQIQKDESDLSATNERALTADNHAGQAMTRADEAGKKADQANQSVSELKTALGNMDDYKPVANTTVNFKFNSDKLTSEAKMALDQMVMNQNRYKRFFIAVEGFTDQVGNAEYNDALSRRRADAVVRYLVGQHDIPIYRIQTVGLGQQKPVEDAKTRAANAKNRRVEVTLFSADQSLASLTQQSGGGNRVAASQQ